MKRVFVILAAIALVATGRAVRATPPGPGQHFDCSDGGDTSCSDDDTGCVPNTSGHSKCAARLDGAFAKAVYAVVKCHEKQVKARIFGVPDVDAGADEEICETTVKNNLQRTIDNLQDAGICDPIQLSNASSTKFTLFDPGPQSLDARNGAYFCDATSGIPIGDDDTGWVPSDAKVFKCEAAVARNVAKLVLYASKCHEKMAKAFFKGRDFEETACEENDPLRHHSAIDKYGKVRNKLVDSGICPPCLDFAAQSQLGNDALQDGDGGLETAFPCNLGP